MLRSFREQPPPKCPSGMGVRYEVGNSRRIAASPVGTQYRRKRRDAIELTRLRNRTFFRRLRYSKGDGGPVRSLLTLIAAFVWGERGFTYLLAGQPEEAIRSFERAIRLSQVDPLIFSTFAGMGAAFISLGLFDEAGAAAKKAIARTDFSDDLSLPRGSSRAPRARCRSPGKRRPGSLSLSPISEYLNGWLVTVNAPAQIRLSTASAKQDFRSDAATASGTSVLGTFGGPQPALTESPLFRGKQETG